MFFSVFSSLFLCHVGKRFDKETKVNFKIYYVINRITNNYNKHVGRYLRNQKRKFGQLIDYMWEIFFFENYAENEVEHGTIIGTGIKHKRIPRYVYDSACRWLLNGNAKIFWVYVQHVWIFSRVTNWRILICLSWFPPIFESPGKSWNLKRVL